MKNKKILITGGAGFIGFNLYKKISKNNEIYILDFKKNINRKPFRKNCKFIYGNIAYLKTFENLKKTKIKFDYIYHLAAETSTSVAELNPKKCYETNVLGTLNLFNYACFAKPKNIIFTSSMAVYGKYSVKLSEDQLCRPISYYGKSKIIGEEILLSLLSFNINIKIFRIFNAYGIFQDYNNPHQGMLSIYLSQIIRKSSVNVTGSLSRSRDFIYIDDIIRAITSSKIIESKHTNIFNLGSGIETKVSKILNLIFKITKKDKKIIIKSKHSGDTNKSCANIKKLNKIGWCPKISLIDGIKKVIKDIYKFDDNNCSFNWKR